MNDIFTLFIENSLWLSAVIAVAILFFRLSRGRFSAKLPCVVWLIIAVKLIIPWNVPLPKAEHAVELSSMSQVYIPPITQMPIGEGVSQPEHYPVGTSEVNNGITTEDMAIYIWLGGIFIAVFTAVFRNASFKKKLRLYSRPASEELRAGLESAAASMDMKAPALNICDRISSPMAMGLLSPEIYLPTEEHGDELEMIFRHELTHIKRHDLWKKMIFMAARTVHWFNPLVYLMVSEASKALEIACDAEVVMDADIEYRKNYSLIILRQAKDDSSSRYLTTCFACGKNTLKARFSEILSLSPKKKGWTIAVLALALCLICGVFVSCKPKDTQTDYDTYEEMATIWAQCLADRNGKARYDMMDADMKSEFEKTQTLDGELIYSIGWSSPWVTDYRVEVSENTATIHYTLQDSIPGTYYMDETLRFGEEDGRKAVVGYVISPLQAEPIGERQQLWEIHGVFYDSGIEVDDTLKEYIFNYIVNTFYNGYSDRYFIDSIDEEFNECNITDTSVEVKLSVKATFHNYDAEVSRLESGIKPERLTNAEDYYGSHIDDKYLEEGIYASYDLIFTCDANYNTDTFMLTDTDGNPFVQPDSFNSSGEKTMFGSIDISGNNVTLSRKQFNTDNKGLTPGGFYITDWGVKENLTLTDETTVSMLNENLEPMEVPIEELEGGYRLFWITVNKNNEILQMTEQYIP